jgi:hypothetical protein
LSEQVRTEENRAEDRTEKGTNPSWEQKKPTGLRTNSKDTPTRIAVVERIAIEQQNSRVKTKRKRRLVRLHRMKDVIFQ